MVVKKMRDFLNFPKRLYNFNRLYSHQLPLIIERLTNKAIFKISGNESNHFLQALTTNDIRCLNGKPNSCMYTLFLNTKGRVLLDAIIYKLSQDISDTTYYIEFDETLTNLLENHLKFYRLRKRIDITNVSDQFQIWQYFSKDFQLIDIPKQPNCFYFPDPRLNVLGFKAFTPASVNLCTGLPKGNCSYKRFRFKLGIGEGAEDFPPEKCLPFEINSDYLNAISLEKGCYLGQELTARSYHTGVIRKRLMPIAFKDDPLANFVNEEPIIDGEYKQVGKLRSVFQNCALGIVKVCDVIKSEQLRIQNLPVTITVPDWWPKKS